MHCIYRAFLFLAESVSKVLGGTLLGKCFGFRSASLWLLAVFVIVLFFISVRRAQAAFDEMQKHLPSKGGGRVVNASKGEGNTLI